MVAAANSTGAVSVPEPDRGRNTLERDDARSWLPPLANAPASAVGAAELFAAP